MANYAVTDWTSTAGSMEDVAAAIETKLETIDNSKTIRLLEVHQLGSALFQAIMIYDA